MNILIRLLWGKNVSEANFGPSKKIWLKYWIIQKILRINSEVPWPVHPTTRVLSPKNIDRGTRTPGLSCGCHIDGRNGIVFGKNVWVGPHVAIISMNHDINNYKKYIKDKSIKIGDNCWIGAKSVILPAVHLGEHTVVAAGSVVTKSFSDGNQLLAGVPARIIKKLSNYEDSEF